MHPRALVYHPARMDHHCQPLFHELIDIHERCQNLTREQLSRDIGALPAATEEDLRGMRNLVANVRAESHLAETIARENLPLNAEGKESEAMGQVFNTLITAFRDYRDAGENIFDFQPTILDLFRQSDLGDAIIDRVRLPFQCFYLHFGVNSRIPVGTDGHILDGVYFNNVDLDNLDATDLTQVVHSVFLMLVTRLSDRDYTARLEPCRFLGGGCARRLGDPQPFWAGSTWKRNCPEAHSDTGRISLRSFPPALAAIR